MHVVSSCLESWRSNQYMRTWHKINKKQGVDSASCMVGSLVYVHFPSHYFSFAPFFSPFFPFGPFSSFSPFSSFYTCFLPFWSFYMWFLLFVFSVRSHLNFAQSKYVMVFPMLFLVVCFLHLRLNTLGNLESFTLLGCSLRNSFPQCFEMNLCIAIC
jgi:hypothetical protein